MCLCGETFTVVGLVAIHNYLANIYEAAANCIFCDDGR